MSGGECRRSHMGSILIPAEYESIGFLNEPYGWIRAKRNGKWGWVDKRGDPMIPFRYDAAMPFKDGQAWVRQEPYPEFFKINREGKMVAE